MPISPIAIPVNDRRDRRRTGADSELHTGIFTEKGRGFGPMFEREAELAETRWLEVLRLLVEPNTLSDGLAS